MTVMEPDGTLDTWYLKEGDVYFIPRAYPHHIEVVDAPDLHFAIFFDQPTPGDIGYRASASAYSAKCWPRRSTCTSTTCRTSRSPRPIRSSSPAQPVDEYAMGERQVTPLSDNLHRRTIARR